MGMYANKLMNHELIFGLLGKRRFLSVFSADLIVREYEVWSCSYFVMIKMSLKLPVPNNLEYENEE